ncbi:hypothetical protein RRG08_001620 [Elysia crispata]|uniref:Uncharacterized protein n=1 Tax=Elysia crispata TaxID=231223 RepID=A0AAE1AJW5_9GAST|nr:hypothetical protein RRG08_001620 [Elysia crispata]
MAMMFREDKIMSIVFVPCRVTNISCIGLVPQVFQVSQVSAFLNLDMIVCRLGATDIRRVVSRTAHRTDTSPARRESGMEGWRKEEEERIHHPLAGSLAWRDGGRRRRNGYITRSPGVWHGGMEEGGGGTDTSPARRESGTEGGREEEKYLQAD